MTNILVSYRGFANETEILSYTTRAHAAQELDTLNNCTNAWARSATKTEVQRFKRNIARNNLRGAGEALQVDVTHRLNSYGDICILEGNDALAEWADRNFKRDIANNA